MSTLLCEYCKFNSTIKVKLKLYFYAFMPGWSDKHD